jgi:hypothetical protein
VSAAAAVTWAMLALLIGWLGLVLWATYLQVDAEWRRARGLVRRPGDRPYRD